MKGPAHDKLWNQLEAEIHLHRHKTVIRACRGRNDSKRPLPTPVGHVSVKTLSFNTKRGNCFYLPSKSEHQLTITGCRNVEENSRCWPDQKGCSSQGRSRRTRNLHYSKMLSLFLPFFSTDFKKGGSVRSWTLLWSLWDQWVVALIPYLCFVATPTLVPYHSQWQDLTNLQPTDTISLVHTFSTKLYCCNCIVVSLF